MGAIHAHHGLVMAAAAGGAADPHWANVVSLLNFPGADASTTFTDATGKTWTPGGNAQIDTSLGYNAGLFDGSGDYVTTPSNAGFDFGSGDFTVECVVRFNSVAKTENQGLVVRDSIGGTRGWLMFTNAGTDTPPRALAFGAWVGGTNYGVRDSVAVTTGADIHVEACRDGGTLRLYKNGVQVDSTAISGSVGAPAQPCAIGNLWGVGAQFNAANSLNGWLRAVRITKGVCRHSGGASFTPPTAPFPTS